MLLVNIGVENIYTTLEDFRNNVSGIIVLISNLFQENDIPTEERVSSYRFNLSSILVDSVLTIYFLL